MLKILKDLPKEVPATASVVDFMRKSTTKTPVPADLKFRCTVVPAYTFAVVAEPTTAQEVFSAAVQEAFTDAASNILQDFCIENMKDGKYPEEISEEKLTFASVLARMSEMQTTQRLTQEQIFSWYDGSKTAEASATRYGNEDSGKKKQAALRAKYGSTASNNPGIDAALAVKMLGYIQEDDLTNPVCRAVAKKLERLSKETVDSVEL